MTLQEFKSLIDHNTVICFKQKILQCSGYAEPGMQARLIRLDKIDKYGSLSFYVSFKGFEDFNKSFESFNYFDNDMKPTLNAHQAGFYEEEESYWAENIGQISDLFSIVDQKLVALLEDFNIEKKPGQTYLDWITEQALAYREIQKNFEADDFQSILNIHDCMDIKTTQPGDKIIYNNPNNGQDIDKKQAEQYLQIGAEYTVEHIDVKNWHTDIFLKEIPGIVFNSVMFSNVALESKFKF